MTYLLDVNALVALGFMHHEFHHRLVTWVRSQPSPKLATCSLTELGFVRVLAQAQAYGVAVSQARTFLLRLRNAPGFPFSFIQDEHDASHLPAWVKTAKQITDGHLSALAIAHGAVLATLDDNISGAYLIPR